MAEKTLKAHLAFRCDTKIAHGYKEERDKFCDKYGITEKKDNAFMSHLMDVYYKNKVVE